MTYIIIGTAVVAVILIVIIAISNDLVRKGIKVEESASGIDVALAKRHDLLTKMVEVVKGYAKHEKEVMFKVVELRSNMTMAEKSAANSEMTEQLDKINMLVENYPDLKASENFKKLQLTILDVEEHLQAARRLYNSNVSTYNESIKVFPNNTIAKLKKLKEKPYFSADEDAKKNVNINI